MSTSGSSAAPASPEQSSNPWALGLTHWWKIINDWIRTMSPAGVSKFDTGWIDIPLTNDYAALGSVPPQVRRVGRELKYRGFVKLKNDNPFQTNTTHVIASDGAIPGIDLRPVVVENHPIAGNQAMSTNGARLNINALGGLSIDVGESASPYFSLFGVRSSSD